MVRVFDNKRTRGESPSSSTRRQNFRRNYPLLLVLATTGCCFRNAAAGQDSPDQEHILETNTRPVVIHLPDLGRIQGKRESGIDFFGGIPYAAPPVGNLRWAPPEPASPWAPAKLDATHFGPDCWQVVDPFLNPLADETRMSEDCLYLNVFTPAGHAVRHVKLPVMIWLHGGAFQVSPEIV